MRGGKILLRFTAWSLALLAASSFARQDGAAPPQMRETPAILFSRGVVTLNGDRISHSDSLFTADRLMTGGQPSLATITLAGSTLLLPPDSCLAYGSGMSVLECGSAVLTTSVGMSLGACSTTVWPTSNQSAKFELKVLPGRLRITALRGGISYSNGVSTEILASGKMITIDQPDCLPSPTLRELLAND